MIPCIFFGQGCMPSTLFSSEERDSWPLKFQFIAVQNKAFYLGYIEEVGEVGIMVFLTDTIDHYVFMDADDSWALFHDKVHFHLDDIL